jgi:hypothetical protein
LQTGTQDIFSEQVLAVSLNSSSIANLNDLDYEPKTYEEAMNCINREHWIKAMNVEINRFHLNGTYSYVNLPANCKALPGKWVYRIKRDSSGNVSQYKARYVVKGFHQREGEDYGETFAPVMKYTSLRLILALAAIQNKKIQQFDVDSAFLNAKLEEDVYILQPTGFEKKGEEHKVCRLHKAVYGLKQAPHAWNGDIHNTLTTIGFKRCVSDRCVYYLISKSGRTIILGLFVDDVIILYDEHDESEWFALKAKIKSKYSIKDLGDASHILGIRITRDRANQLLYLDQESYIDRILNKFRMNDCNPVATPGSAYDDLQYNEQLSSLDPKRLNYLQQLNGSLLYSAISTRPDIAHSVIAIAKYVAKAQENHITAAKRVFRYLQGSKSLKLVMDGKREIVNSSNKHNSSTLPEPILTAYSDSDFAGDRDDRKSMSGYVIKLNNCPIYWLSRKQRIVAQSTCEAELIALAEIITQLQWIHNFLIELRVFNSQQPPTAIVYCDNKSTIDIAKQDMANTKTKHIAVKYYYIKQAFDDGLVQLQSIKSENNLADLFTKPLKKIKFNQFKFMLMGEC